jgi:hypothetical protein
MRSGDRSMQPLEERLALVPQQEIGTRPNRHSLLALYLLGAFTGGLYLNYWTYGVVKATRERSAGSAGPLAAALGSAVVPVQAALLFDLYRQSRARRGLATGGWPCSPPALLAIAIFLTLTLLPWRSLWTPLWLLAPLPFLLVQSSINRETGVLALPLRNWNLLAHGLVGLIGVAATVAVAYFYDLPAARLASHRSLEAGEPISGSSALYALRLTETGWRRTSPGTLGGEDSELELVSSDESSWVISYVHAARERTLHDTVASRRAVIRETGELEAFDEVRRFATGSDLIPISIARYQIASPALLRKNFLVYTAAIGERVVEIIGFSSSRSGWEAVRTSIESVELTSPRAEQP